MTDQPLRLVGVGTDAATRRRLGIPDGAVITREYGDQPGRDGYVITWDGLTATGPDLPDAAQALAEVVEARDAGRRRSAPTPPATITAGQAFDGMLVQVIDALLRDGWALEAIGNLLHGHLEDRIQARREPGGVPVATALPVAQMLPYPDPVLEGDAHQAQHEGD